MRQTRRVHRSLVSFLAVVFVLGTTWTTTSRQRSQCDAATLYALYNLPSCTLTMETTAVGSLPTPLSGSGGLLSETNGHNSGLSFPLRTATQNFLLEQFERNIGQLETQANAQDPTILYPWYSMYAHLVGVDLVLQMFWVDETTTTSSSEGVVDGESPQKVTTIRVEMVGSLAFEEPGGSAVKPSNDQVYLMFGQWMESIFTTQRGSYWNAVMASNQDVLQQAVLLDITTALSRDGGDGNSSRDGGSNPIKSERSQQILLSLLLFVCSVGVLYSMYALRRNRNKRTVRRLMNASVDGNYNNHHGGGGGGGYRDGDDDGEYNFSGSVKEPSEGMDAMRHGSDIIYAHRSAQSVLESTDRYLSKHRPDLYTDATRDEQGSMSHNSTSTTNNNNNNIQVFGREYTIPSNPFGILYSAFQQEARFEVSPQGAFTPRSRRNSVIEEQQVNNLAAGGFEDDETTTTASKAGGIGNGIGTSRSRQFEDEPYHDDYGGEDYHYSSSSQRGPSTGFRPISSIWRNFTQMWDSERREPHDDIFMQAQATDLELQSGQFQYSDHVSPLDEIHDYDFAFKDFPRHDGTPCLIFNDNGVLLTPRQREVFEIDSPQTSPTNHMLDKGTVPVSDEAFQRMLAAQGGNPRSLSPDDSLFLESSFAGDDDNIDTTNSDVASSGTNVAPQFKEELARLYEQKFRQYEKKAIVEKHQERREKERKAQREQERRDRHKVMEGTIEDLEGAIGTTPRWQSTQSSPKPYNYSPKQSSSSSHPHPHRSQTHSPKPKYSPFRTGHHHSDNISRASPASRKPVMMDWDRDLANNTGSVAGVSRGGVALAPGARSLAVDEPFRMRPRTMHPLGAAGDGNFVTGQMSASSFDYSTLDKLSLPPMTSTKKYSPNAVMDDIFGGAPTSISTRKTNTGSSSVVGTRSDSNPTFSHRRVNSLDHKAILGYERPLPQQRRRPKAGGPTSTSNLRTRSRTPTRTLTPTRTSGGGGLHLGGQGRTMNHSLSYSQHGADLPSNGTSTSSTSSSLGGPRRRRSASPAPRGDVFTHGVVAHTRLV